MKNKILISCANGEISYELISFLKKKYYVIGIDNNKLGLAKKICDKFFVSPKGKSKKFPKFINKISKNVDAIFLFADEEILNISKNINKFENLKKKILISDYKTISICNDKKKLEVKLGKLVNFPALKKSKEVLIKPKIGRGSKNIIILKDQNIIKSFKNNNKYLVQEFIEGKEFTTDCFFKKNGVLHQLISRERIVKKNVSIIGKTVKDKNIISIVKKISNYLKFKGSVNFQFIKKNNKYYLLEINPRISGSIIFSIRSKFDIIKYNINHLKNLKLKINKINYNKIYFRYYQTYN